MKNILLLTYLSLSSTLSIFAQDDILEYQENDPQLIKVSVSDQAYLLNNEWFCYRLHIEKRKEDYSKSAFLKFQFSEDQKFKQNKMTGTWNIVRDSFLFLELENLDEQKHSHFLRGHYGIKQLNDSILTLTKILTTSEDYRYTYYFENANLYDTRNDSRFSIHYKNARRYKEFNQQYRQGLTVIDDKPKFKKVVIVSPINCGYYEKKTLDDGNTIYTKDGNPISKFDYEYDITVANQFPTEGFKEPRSKEERFMRGEKN